MRLRGFDSCLLHSDAELVGDQGQLGDQPAQTARLDEPRVVDRATRLGEIGSLRRVRPPVVEHHLGNQDPPL